MFPNIQIFGLTLHMYGLAISIGIILALVIFTKLCDKDQIPVKVTNFYLIVGIISIGVGFLFATLFQSFYEFLQTGKFKISGMTFMGGLVGGAGTFLLSYVIFKKPEHKAAFSKICSNALCAIAIAHCFGRIGCFLAGCCHGKRTDSIFGIQFPFLSYKVYPTQLFEAIFLLGLFFLLLFRRKHAIYIYPICYGVFRFFIEFLRGDDRGQFIDAISPSQIQSIIFILVGIALIVYSVIRKKAKN